MIEDPERRGRVLAEFYRALEPSLFRELEESGLLPAAALSPPAQRARREWECFALYACVRGLVAAGGFNRETGTAIDALHEAVLAAWMAEPSPAEPFESRRARVADRYGEYGTIGQAGRAAGGAAVTARLGEACARHIAADEPAAGLAEFVEGIHEALAEGAAEAVRQAEPEE